MSRSTPATVAADALPIEFAVADAAPHALLAPQRRSGKRDALKSLVTVTDLAHELGISARTLRFYEDKGLIAPRRIGAARVYSHRERARMILILRGKELGFSLREIQDYLDLYDADPKTRNANARPSAADRQSPAAIGTKAQRDRTGSSGAR